jgi:precorrin-6A/cobalt-precorrin-6A reductase
VKVLILGGTAEARALAAALHRHQGCSAVVSSLAGRVTQPLLPEGQVRIGGFGGAPGLAEYLRAEAFDAMVDATHPFAAGISAEAAQAADAAGVRLLALRRPSWSAQPGDRWTHVPDIDHAARCTAELPEDNPGCVFVTTGRRGLEAFAQDPRHTYVIRSIEPPGPPLPPRHIIVLDRGPFTLEDETALMERHAVSVLVTKNSGGAATEAKLTAARLRGIPVIVVDPPAPPDGVEQAPSVPDVLTLLNLTQAP